MKLEITSETKIASLATIIGMLIAYYIFPDLVVLVPLGILAFLFFSYPGTEKVGIVGMTKYLQTMFAVTLIAVIGIMLMAR